MAKMLKLALVLVVGQVAAIKVRRGDMTSLA
jgi:hypothetical protein